MILRYAALCLVTLLASQLSVAVAADGDAWRAPLRPFLQTHCVDCHQGEEAGGGLKLGELSPELTHPETMRLWVLVHDRIAKGEMPPADHPQPTAAEKSQALTTLSAALSHAHRAQRDTVLRRLNRIEYENTVRDLFGVYVEVSDLLPEDTPAAGFDNVGEGLAVSAEAMQAYLRAADVALDAVFGPPKKPKSINHKTNLRDLKTHDGKPYLDRFYGRMFRRTDEGVVIFQSNYCPTNLVNFARLRPPAGTYRGTIRVRAIQSKEPVTLRIYGGDTIVGRREKHLVGYYDIPPDKWTTIKFTDRLVETGGTYQPKCYGTRDTRKNADTYPEPGLEIGDITIEGPLEQWPPHSRKALLGNVDPAKGTWADAKTILNRMAPRIFRRPAAAEEIEPYLRLVKSALDDGRPFESALRLGLKGMLCSPEFLFLDEQGAETINDYALASRLSYLFWSSLPDEELLSLAKAGKLHDKDTLHAQVERLLKDPRSKAFTVNFVGQWLDLRDIDFTSPEQNLYPEFDELLKISMVEETHRYFDEMVDRNLSLRNIVDSDFAILNERLAKHYGIAGVRGQEFRTVDLPADSVRGGLLTQASILKVTANGTNTSPVLRGAWVMENIMGLEVPPPPANAPAVEPDIRGATTLREQLAKHRNVESCAVCHNKIDPPGFALENFDVIGGWREKYRTLGEGKRPDFSQHPITFAWVRYRIGLPVDATGKTADGRAFDDIRQFKQILLKDEKAFARGVTHKLTTYALGRSLGFSDRADIDRIVRKVATHNNGFRTLLHEIVQSPLFRRP